MVFLTAAQSLLGFAGWTGLHVLLIGAYRVSSVMMGRAKPNSFPSGKPHGGPDIYQNMIRAHANCVENLPLLAIVILLNKIYNGPNLDSLAEIYLLCRIGQSVIHWLSTRNIAINIRFFFFACQLGVLGRMAQLTLPVLSSVAAATLK